MIPIQYTKRSFRRFAEKIDLEKLRNDFHRIPDEEWSASYWGDIHCSVGMLLLRGGKTGAQEDFYCDSVYDHPVLKRLDYIRSLIAEDGPFGGAKYAFIFRMNPGGVTLVHRDTMEQWFQMYRIHIPIFTNPGAFLISSSRSQHFGAGYAWSFDNQSRHGVVNGDEERVHLIFDVEWNDRLRAQVESSEILAGDYVEKHVDAIHSKKRAIPSYFGDPVIRGGIQKLRARGLNDEQIVQFFNAKKVPTKTYYQSAWNLGMIKEIEHASASKMQQGKS